MDEERARAVFPFQWNELPEADRQRIIAAAPGWLSGAGAVTRAAEEEEARDAALHRSFLSSERYKDTPTWRLARELAEEDE